jgi:hypothetical protein
MFETTEKCLQKVENLEERDHFEDQHDMGIYFQTKSETNCV